VHFLVWAATMQGRSQEALAASIKVASRVPEDMRGNDWALYQTFLSMPLYTMARFGMWQEILEQPKPRPDATYWSGVYHYARGVAQAHLGDEKKARKELAALDEIRSSPGADEIIVSFSNARTLLTIASETLQGEIAGTTGQHAEAVLHLDRAVRLEESLLYNEPPSWHYPLRHTLGAALLAANRPVEAEVVYWQDLRSNQGNGFALFGLVQAYEAQGDAVQASSARKQFEAAWKAADVELSSSRY
jgi:predicted Zn-dependent protease